MQLRRLQLLLRVLLSVNLELTYFLQHLFQLNGAGRREWVLRFEITKTAVNVVPEVRTVAK